MTQLNAIQLFEGKQVRIAWDEEEEKYYFSIADIVQILTDSKDIKQYIKRMRTRDPELNSRWGTIKQWLSEVGAQRIDQMIDPELTFQIVSSYRLERYPSAGLWRLRRVFVEMRWNSGLLLGRIVAQYAKKLGRPTRGRPASH